VKDLQKEMQICSKEFEERWNVFCETHGSSHNKSVAKYFFFSSWQQAKAWVVPEGFVLVPKEPTSEMLYCGYAAPDNLAAKYKAMIEAAQEPAND